MTNIVLIIAQIGFQPVEYRDTREVLERNGFQVTVVSNQAGKTYDAAGNPGPEVTITIDKVSVDDCAGVFLIGGAGAMKYLDNQKVYDLMRSARDAEILWGAICIAPRILCKAGLLDGARITGWDGDGNLKSSCPEAHIIDSPVVVEGKHITARDPAAARAFGQAIVTALSL